MLCFVCFVCNVPSIKCEHKIARELPGWSLLPIGRRTSSPDDLLVPQGLSARFWETVIINDNARALLKSWDEVLKNLYGVLVALVVEYPAEEVDCATTLVNLVHNVIME